MLFFHFVYMPTINKVTPPQAGWLLLGHPVNIAAEDRIPPD